jgi:hypothetical protein
LRFHLGIPHVFNLFAIQAITLPAKVRPWRTRIYVQPQFWDPGSAEGLGLILHEAFHALQIQEAGPGVGLLRPYLVLYLACAAGNGFRYAGHPLEDDAYRVAGDWESPFESSFRGPAASRDFAWLATPASGLRFWERLAGSTPGWRRSGRWRFLLVPWAGLWFLLWTAVAAVLAVAKVTVEGVGAMVWAASRTTRTSRTPRTRKP